MAQKPSELELIVSNTLTTDALGKVNWDAVGGIWESLLQAYPPHPVIAGYLRAFAAQSLGVSKNFSALSMNAYRDWLSTVNMARAQSQLLKEIDQKYKAAKTPVDKARLLTTLYTVLQA